MVRRNWMILVGAGIVIAAGHWFSMSYRPHAAHVGRSNHETARGAEPGETRASLEPGPASLNPEHPLSLPFHVNLIEEPWAQRALADSDQESVRLFDEGMRLLGSGNGAEARSLFEGLIASYPNDRVKALATWAIGLTYLAEGGTHNLHQAANQLIRFRDSYESDADLEPLLRAAMIDIPVILIDLMRYAPSEYERTHAAELAQKTLKSFLARWPKDPQAPAARASLAEVESFMAQPR